MILYWNEGKRSYGKYPVPVYRRIGWEFQYFVSGTCLLLKGNGKSELVPPGTLWVFSPETAHGWGGERDSDCEIRVVHFSRVREPLGVLCSRRGSLMKQVSEYQLRSLDAVFQKAGMAYKLRSPISDLHAERLLLELSLLVLPEDPMSSKDEDLRREERIVYEAISYFRDHMHAGVTVEDVAKAVSVSSSHLRRLFRVVKGMSPRHWFRQEQIQRGEEMLKETTYTIDAIAASCGYETGGSLIRAFKSDQGVTPGRFRKENSRRSIFL